jgi:hypothetical protein
MEVRTLLDARKMRFPKLQQYWLVIALGVLLFNNIIYANQVYLKKDLEYQNTMSTMNRIIDRMEETDGYVLGETPVVLIGYLTDSELSVDRDGLKMDEVGLGIDFSVSYYQTYSWYFKYILAYPINLMDAGVAEQWSGQSAVMEMSAFPAKDSCQMIDGTMVVKLS